MDGSKPALIERGGFTTTTIMLNGDRKRIVHVIAKALAATLETGEQHELIGVRDFDFRENLVTARHVEILGPSELWHTPDEPLPGTNGRGIAYLVTSAPLRLHIDAVSPKPRKVAGKMGGWKDNAAAKVAATVVAAVAPRRRILGC